LEAQAAASASASGPSTPLSLIGVKPRNRDKGVRRDPLTGEILPPKSAGTTFADQPVRKVALLMSYEGWHYSGLAIQTAPISQPTVEGVLLAALEKTHLIEQGAGWEGCGFSRCGRTDRGVSSSAQVVTLWLKSKRRRDDAGNILGNDWQPDSQSVEALQNTLPRTRDLRAPRRQPDEDITSINTTATEYPYPYLLNRVLPPTIRILGWSPLQDNASFDARFSCISRHYKYFFPLTPIAGRPPLDLDLMQQAANNLVGEHDFRNFCKVDGSKQIENHRRGVISATISQGDEDCVFELIGTAFLWHQVRHIMAVLLLVGSGLEPPAVVKALLNTSLSPVDVATNLASAETIDGKPLYQMASALPLQLYRCNYNDGEVDWRYGGYDGPYGALSDSNKLAAEASSQSTVMGLLQSLKTEAIEANMRARHIQQFYDEAAEIYSSPLSNPQSLGDSSSRARVNATLYSVGSGEVLSTKNYVPLLQRARTETPDEINKKWREGGGARRSVRKAAEQLSLDTPEDR